MDVGCGGVGLRTSHGDVVNLYFWHMETEDGVSVRHEDYLGRADSPRVKRELVRRMAQYDRRAEQGFARRIAKLEERLAQWAPTADAPLASEGERRRGNARVSTSLMVAGVPGT